MLFTLASTMCINLHILFLSLIQYYYLYVYNAIINIPQYYTMENAIMLPAIYVTGCNGEW